jgi:arylsulfatase A
MKLSGETFVIFTSDNGPEGTGLPDLRNPGSRRDRTRGSTGGLRGRKRDGYEGGIRVPGIVRWPGRVKPATESSVPVIGSDIFATICGIADVPLPTDRTIDGESMLPALEGKPIARDKPLYWRTHIASPSSRAALRLGDWKIVADEELTKFELYNLADDPQERRDLSATEPEKFAELTQALIEMDREIKSEGPDWWKTQP